MSVNHFDRADKALSKWLRTPRPECKTALIVLKRANCLIIGGNDDS